MLLTKKRLYKIKNSYNQTQKKRKIKKGGRKRRYRKRRRRSFSNKRKPLNLRRTSLKKYGQKGGNLDGNFYWLVVTPGTDINISSVVKKPGFVRLHLIKVNDLYLKPNQQETDAPGRRMSKGGFWSFLTNIMSKEQLKKNLFYGKIV